MYKEVGHKDSKGKQGLWKYYDGKYLRIEVTFLDDKEEGKWKRYFNSGKLALIIDFKDGVKDGAREEFYDNGFVKERGRYEKGNYYIIDFFSKDGTQTLKNGTGTRIEKFGYNDNDVYEQYFENGKMISEKKISSAFYTDFKKKPD